MTVKEAKELNIIPEDYKFLPEKCPTCKSDLIVNDNLTSMECSNIYCLDRVSNRAEQMLKNFNIAGVGIQFCKKFFTIYPYHNHTVILISSLEQLIKVGGEAQGKSAFQQIRRVISRIWTFDDIVAKLALPYLNQDAYKVFKNIGGWKAFKYALKKLNITYEEYLSSIDGFGEIKAKNISETLINFDVDLRIVDNLFKKYIGNKKSFTICITGYPGFKSMTKQEFINYIKKLCDGYISIIEKKSFTYDCDFLIASNKYMGYPIETLSNKHRLALKREEEENTTLILTAEEFINIVLKEKEAIIENGRNQQI